MAGAALPARVEDPALLPTFEGPAAELAVLLVDAANEVVGRFIVVADPNVALAFLVVGTNPVGFLGPAVDRAKGFETTRFAGTAGDEGVLRLFAFIPVERGFGIDDFIAGDDARRGKRDAERCYLVSLDHSVCISYILDSLDLPTWMYCMMLVHYITLITL